MIKKIQQYLLLHYPLIWNIRLVPMLLILIVVHLILFGISFLSSEVRFEDYYYYRSMLDTNGIAYFAAIFVGILIFIGWLSFYMRNNAIKVFYPRKTSNIFTEWVLTFVVCLMITSLPISLASGTLFRVQMVASEKQTEQALDLLDKASVLIPSDISDYQFNDIIYKPLPIADSIKINPHDVDLDKYAFDYTLQGKIAIRGYKGASLLFYGDYQYNNFYEYGMRGEEYNYYQEGDDAMRKIKNIDTVKRWLRNGQKDSIYVLMNDFCELAKKHNLQVDLSPELWMKRIYNAPYFAVEQSNMIRNSIDADRYYNNSYDYRTVYDPNRNEYYVIDNQEDTISVASAESDIAMPVTPSISASLPLLELQSGYKQVHSSYTDNDELCDVALVCTCMALMLSVFIFSCRMTSGRSWLIAFVLAGVLIFAIVLLMIILSEIGGFRDRTWAMTFTLFWIALFVAIIIYMIGKNVNNINKGRSRPLMNIMLWLLPCIIPIGYAFGIALYENATDNYYSPTGGDISFMFWINIPIVIISMFFISSLLRKWKSLPEE